MVRNSNRSPANSRNKNRMALKELLKGNHNKALKILSQIEGKVKFKVSYANRDKEGNVIRDGIKYTEAEYKTYCQENNITYITQR